MSHPGSSADNYNLSDEVLDKVRNYSELKLQSLLCQGSFYEFVKLFWKDIEPMPYVDNWHIRVICEHLEAVTRGDIKRLVINIPPGCGKSLLVSVLWPAWEWAKNCSVRFFCASYDQKLSTRDSVKMRSLIEGQLYQSMYGSFRITRGQDQKTYYETDKGGWRMATSVGGHGTGEHPDRVVIDDPHNVQQAESEVERQSVIDWCDLTMSSRGIVRDVRWVVIMQRLHERDFTAHVLNKGGYVHLCLPMRYEPDRTCITPLGKPDPRTEEGELLVPQLFPEFVVRGLEKDLGQYGCNPAEAPVLMGDLSMKTIGEIRPGDEIIGFDKKERKDGVRGRFKLTKAVVTEVHVRKAPVVKMTLDSGEVIRCTRDHRWFMKNKGPDREMYLPVTLGKSRLSRVCPPRLPVLSSEEDFRLAGWLSGFFDGEGTVTSGRREAKGDYRPANSVCFYQGAGRNLPLCNKLESVLTRFSFRFSVREDDRKDNKTAACYGYRQYKLLDKGLPMIQRFLHIVRPTKWRDRFVASVLGCKFVTGREKVISIEPDGEEPVYALTTTTGNYVVWGLASSNSAGQLQQRPAPRGGGMFKDWYFNKRVKAAPYDCTRIRYTDRAATADGGCFSASVLMGKSKTSPPVYYVEHVFKGQWEPRERNQKIVAAAHRDRAKYGSHEPVHVIEAERGSTGLESFQNIAAMLAGFRVREDQPSGSKDTRAEPWSDQLAAGNVYIVDDGTWDVQSYVEEHVSFKPEPGKRIGKYKDQVDASSGAFNLLAGTKIGTGIRVVSFSTGKKTTFKIVVCSSETLSTIVLDNHASVLVSISDPPPLGTDEIPAHGLTRLVGSLKLRFADVQPADYQDCWETPLADYGKLPAEVIMTREHGKTLWGFLLKKREFAPQIFVIHDDNNARGASLACGICDGLGYRKNETIYTAGDPTPVDKAPIPYLYEVVRASRSLVM